MFKQTLLAFATAVIGLLTPMTALAAPGNVRNIMLEKSTDGVVVQWQAVQEKNIESYKIFWSRESILENDALYDDVVDTEEDVTEYELTDLPKLDQIFVTVLAVDANGEESPLFEEEASLLLTASSSSSSAPVITVQMSSASASSVQPTQIPVMENTSTVLQALQAEVLSATGVKLHFTLPVVLDMQTAKTAFTIRDASDQLLPIYRVKTDGTTVELHTQLQTRSRPYRVHIDQSLRGRTAAADSVVLLSAEQTDLLFLGHASGSIAVQNSSGSSTAVGDVSGIEVSAVADGINTHTVTISWKAPLGSQIAGYRVSQTRDGGKTFGAPQTLAATVTAVKMPKTESGEVGLLIQVIDSTNTASRGVLQRVVLPRTAGGLPASSIPGKNTPLPQTGAGTAALLAIAGAWAGTQMQRRRAMRA